tara:strand:+ start:33 stop:365 length:333 start_codon:yes stop_codon:yes gene_type:complete
MTMTDEYRPDIEDDDEQGPDIEANDDIEEGDDPNLDIAVNDEQWEEVEEEEEEIDPAEVERVVESVGQLMENVESDSVYEILHSAYEKISDLVDWEDEDDTNTSGQAEAA